MSDTLLWVRLICFLFIKSFPYFSSDRKLKYTNLLDKNDYTHLNSLSELSEIGVERKIKK